MSDEPKDGFEQWAKKRVEMRVDGAKYSSEANQPARTWLAAKLREVADHIENPEEPYPIVAAIDIPENPIGKNGLMESYSVHLSWPLPG